MSQCISIRGTIYQSKKRRIGSRPLWANWVLISTVIANPYLPPSFFFIFYSLFFPVHHSNLWIGNPLVQNFFIQKFVRMWGLLPLGICLEIGNEPSANPS
jgi:hypothetical protein